MTVTERFLLPEGFERVECEEGSFAAYVQAMPLKEYGTPVREFESGKVDKEHPTVAVYERVLFDNNEQCADACMRTWAEYLYERGEYDRIKFTLSGGKKLTFNGYTSDRGIDKSYNSFKKYMRYVYAYAYTGSLGSDLTKRSSFKDVAVGDVLNKPKTSSSKYGHAVMVCDVARNAETGEVIFMMMQGSTPAVNLHVLTNPASKEGSPWFSAQEARIYITDTWYYEVKHLGRFS